MTCRMLIAALAVSAGTIFAQDPRYLNTNQSLLNLNPAFAGSSIGIRNQASARVIRGNREGTLLNIWSNNFEIPFLKQNSYSSFAIGHTRYNYFSGNDIQSTTLTYARAIPISKKAWITPALQAGLGRWTTPVYFERTVTGEKMGPVWRFADINAGLVFFAGSFIGGAAVYHVNTPEIRDRVPFDLQAKYTVHASYTFKFSGGKLLQIGGNYQTQGDVLSMNGHANLLSGPIFAGLGCARVLYSGMPENWPYVSAGYRFGKLAVQATYNPVLAGRVIWGHGFELHASLSISKLLEPVALEML